MNNLPIQVIGNVLSHMGAAREVIIASATCRTWRKAFRRHLLALSFNSDDWPVYRELTPARLEILITRTLFQTSGLQGLSIMMDDVDEFAASTVISWLMYTRKTLRWLFYNVRTTPNINILEICGRQKLEMLVLAHSTIIGVEPHYQRFPCLTSLSLSYVSISALDLNMFLSACPTLESLVLVNPDIVMSDALDTVELNSPTLKSIYVESISLDKFIVEADNLESLHFKFCALELFELLGKGALKYFKIDDVSIIHLDIGEAVDNLENIDVKSFTIIWSKFFQIISRSSKLRRLRLWDVVFDDEDDVLDLEIISDFFPNLNYLALSYDLTNDMQDGNRHYDILATSHLDNVVTLELGWTVINNLFGYWVSAFLNRCPNLQNLVIHGVIPESKTQEECRILANFTSFIVQLMRSYMHVDVHFLYE